jgi:ribosome biogenesis GTPase / thiamine phosphate phosphatase
MNEDIEDNEIVNLANLGWNSVFEKHFKALNIPDAIFARVISESKNSFLIHNGLDTLQAEIAGKMRYENNIVSSYPVVGDWAAVKKVTNESKGVILSVLPRKSKFSRKTAGERTEEQIVSANIDTVFIVSGLDGKRNFNVRRIERYLTLAWNSGAAPVIILNKVDLCTDVEALIQEVENIAPGIPVHAVSATEVIGIDALRQYLTVGNTAAFLGSSGAGKSSIINSLLGEEKQKTGDVRQDDGLGRHTTTRRELIILTSGGMVIDTPGMREIQMWADEGDMDGVFQDIERLAENCRFSDCSHRSEPGCAVKAAIENGELDSKRLESYHKLQNEVNYLAFREEQNTRLYEKQKWKKVAKWVKELKNRP